MSFSISHLAEILIEGYVKTPLPLKDQAIQNIALQLCYNSKLKKHIFSPKLEITGFYFADNVRNQWEESFKKHSTEACKTFLLPNRVQEKLIGLVRSIALQLLIWRGEWKELLDISCDFTAHVWMPTDWTEGRLNERKVAERLMQDDRLSIHQRYGLACIYCLEEFIRPLWNQLPLEQNQFPLEQSYFSPFGVVRQKWQVIEIWSQYTENPELFPGFSGNRFFLHLFSMAIGAELMDATIYSFNKFNDRQKHVVIESEFDCMSQRLSEREENDQTLPFMKNFSILLPPAFTQGYITCFILSQIREHKITGFEAMLKSHECLAEYYLNGLIKI